MALVQVEVGKLYLISLLDPFKDIDCVSPLQVPLRDLQDWQTIDAESGLKNVRRMRCRPGVVLRYNDATKTAVVLLGSSHPFQPHKFVPWYGTARVPFQTSDVLCPRPLEAFLEHHGHMNFSHAIHVRVFQPAEYGQGFWNSPGLSLWREIGDIQGGMEITLPDDQITLLKTLHTNYWDKQRYSETGVLQFYGDTDVGTEEGAETSEPRGLVTPTVLGASSSGTPLDRNPMHEPLRLSISARVACILHKEDERNLQIELLDEDEDLTSLPVLSVLGAFQPLTKKILDMLSSGHFNP